jgi:hypothetical protein
VDAINTLATECLKNGLDWIEVGVLRRSHARNDLILRAKATHGGGASRAISNDEICLNKYMLRPDSVISMGWSELLRSMKQ